MGTVYFEDLAVGERIGSLDKGRMTTAHIMRWSAAVENWHRIHYDWRFATEHDKLPDVLINGSWKQHVLVQLVKDSLGDGGWLWKIRFRYKRMDIAGDSIRAGAEVLERQEIDGLGFVTVRVALTNQNDEISTAGFAIGVVPLRDGPPVPYPFVARPAYDAVRMPEDD
ncbi:MAG: MaoC family dehydratase [Burkholderiales bacterium]|nr:MAG: MaoC family dehydratase [Burkholderiales bacterium]